MMEYKQFWIPAIVVLAVIFIKIIQNKSSSQGAMSIKGDKIASNTLKSFTGKNVSIMYADGDEKSKSIALMYNELFTAKGKECSLQSTHLEYKGKMIDVTDFKDGNMVIKIVTDPGKRKERINVD